MPDALTPGPVPAVLVAAHAGAAPPSRFRAMGRDAGAAAQPNPFGDMLVQATTAPAAEPGAVDAPAAVGCPPAALPAAAPAAPAGQAALFPSEPPPMVAGPDPEAVAATQTDGAERDAAPDATSPRESTRQARPDSELPAVPSPLIQAVPVPVPLILPSSAPPGGQPPGDPAPGHEAAGSENPAPEKGSASAATAATRPMPGEAPAAASPSAKPAISQGAPASPFPDASAQRGAPATLKEDATVTAADAATPASPVHALAEPPPQAPPHTQHVPLPNPAPPALAPLPSAPTTPAQQVAPVIAAVLAPRDDGTPQPLIIRLDPAELGRVQVRIDREAGGSSRISLSVERPDTLMMLVRDQPELHRALDLAGIPAEGRSLQFQLSPDPAPMPQGSVNLGPGGSGMSNPGGGQPGQDRRGPQSPYHAAHEDRPTPSHPSRRRRAAGIDITA